MRAEPNQIGSAESALRAVWRGPDPPSAEALRLAELLEQPVWFAQVLLKRGIEDPAAARTFLRSSTALLHDPMLLCGMREAVDRILLAVQRREAILVYGDYDVDGTTATVLLKTAIDRVTPAGMPSLVRYHIPHRIREGYGMQQAVLADAKAAGVSLIISVDTGIRAFAAADEAKRLSLDLIITDHHLPDGRGIPDAVAVINPNQVGCDYPYKELCGAAVAFKLAHALLLAATKAPAGGALRPVDAFALQDKLLPSLLKLVAIATIADAVPLTGENRAIVALGLAALQEVKQAGLRALLDLAEVSTSRSGGPSATEIAFRVAPRINAAGRMDVASDVVTMLLSRDPVEARGLAQKLHTMNVERRAVEASVLEVLEAQIAEARKTADAMEEMGCVIFDGEGWHRGVIGILASRAVERTGRPALVITHEAGESHGSGRSIAGFHLLDAITHVHDSSEPAIFNRFGGHAHAVGFSLPTERVALLRERMSAYAASRITETMTQVSFEPDAEISAEEMDKDLLAKLGLLEPFGQANREPVFVLRNVTLAQPPQVLKMRHAKLRLRAEAGAEFTALCWSRQVVWPERLAEMGIDAGVRLDVIGRVTENAHPQFGGAELEICDLRIAASKTA